MTWWPGGNARQRLGPQAREAQRPDHRLMGTTRAGTGPAPSQQEIIVTTVVVHGTGPTSGVFIYNGTPGLGNPPQIAEVPTGVTTDPYGNAITSSNILMQGNVITETGGIFRTAATAPLIQLDGPHDALLIYDASANLIIAGAPAAGNDGIGHAFPQGLSTIAAGASQATLVSGTLLLRTLGVNASASAGGLSVGSTATSQLVSLGSGTGPGAGETASSFNLNDSGVGKPALQVVDGRTGAVVWNTQRLRQSTTSTQTFTLASAVAITGLSVALGLGTSHVRVYVPFIPTGVIGSSHNLGLSFTGTATANVNGQCFQSTAANGAVNMAFLNGGTLSSTVPSPTHVAQPGLIQLEADITVTVAGTLTPNITLGTAGDNIITSAGTFWEINPET